MATQIKASAQAISFADWIRPLQLDSFVHNYWQQSHCHFQGGHDRLRDAAAVLPAGDIAQFLDLADSSSIQAFCPSQESVHEQVSVANKVEALRLYKSGRTLYFHLDPLNPKIAQWQQAWLQSTGLGCSHAQLSIFAGQQTTGIAPHFDANENFTLQLVGSKRWRVTPNHQVTQPTANQFAGEPTEPSMRAFVHESLAPKSAGATTINLCAGDLLYCPAGMWHQTEATTAESISLNIMLPKVCKADVFLQTLRCLLVQDPRWRERADDLIGPQPEFVLAEFAELIACLPEQLQRLPLSFRRSQAIARVDLRTARLIRNRLVAWEIGAIACGQLQLTLFPPLEQPICLRIAPAEAAAVRRFAEQDQGTTLDECLILYPELNTHDLQRLLEKLCSAGFLRPT